MIDVTAKVGGLHPATGLYLDPGQTYTIDESLFSDQVFERVDTAQSSPAETATAGGAQ